MSFDFVIRFGKDEGRTTENGRFHLLKPPQPTQQHPCHWDLAYADSDHFTLVGRGVVWNWLSQTASSAGIGQADFWHHFQQSFVADGLDFIAQLEGQFCFVLFDKLRQKLYAIRDQSGTYPLYYTNTPDGFVVGSQLSDLRPFLPSMVLSLTGAACFFRLGYVLAPQTLLEGVFKLLPIEAVVCDENGRLTHKRYWQQPSYQPQPKPEATFLAETRQHIRDVVAKNIGGSGQLGLFLSGGIDSSLLLALLDDQFQQHPYTYTFGLTIDYKRANYLRDLPYAREIAASLDVPYHEILIGHDFPVAKLLREVVPQFDSLLVTPNTLTKYWLAKLGAAHGVKTMLTGSASTAGFYAFAPSSFRKVNFASDHLFHEMTERFRKPILTPAEISGLLPSLGSLPATLLHDALLPYWANVPNDDPIYQFENGLLLSTIAEKVMPVHIDLERLTGVAFKLPLADNSLWQFKATVPRHLTAGNADYTDKFLLKEAFKELVPVSICQRDSGVGFPSYYWFQGELDRLHKVLFSPDVLRLVPEVETAVLHQIVAAEKQSTRKSKGKRTWALTVFLLWYLHFIEGESLTSL
ncbi:MAG: asparagine synthase-related protein [Chloroflexota bacterium]